MSQTRAPADPNALRAALEAVPLFRDLAPDDLAMLLSSVRTRRYRRGEVIFHQGDPGDALHIILSGRVKISSPSDTGVEAILATLRAGRVLRVARAARRRAALGVRHGGRGDRDADPARATGSASSSTTSRRSATTCSRSSRTSCDG